MAYILGIDPGLSGGLSFLDPEAIHLSPNHAHVYNTPVLKTTFVKKGKKKNRNDMDLDKAREIIVQYDVTYAYLEEVHAMPGQGVTGMFRFGENFGEWQGLLVGIGIPRKNIIKVTPQKWKSALQLRSADKTVARDLAKDLFPLHEDCFKRVKDDGAAESLLIAVYGCYDLGTPPDLGLGRSLM